MVILSLMALIRSAGISGFRTAVAELGGDADDIARRAGLPEGCLDSADVLVDDVAIARALELAARELDCPELGLRIGSRQDLNVLGPLGMAVRHSSSLKDALHHATSYMFVHARGLGLQVVSDPQGVRGVVGVRYDVGPARPYSAQGTAMVLAFLHRVALDLVGGPYGLRSVDLPFRPRSRTAYESYFGVPVRFGRPEAMARVAANLDAALIPGRDDELQRLAVAMLERHRRDPADEVVALVRSVLVPTLSLGTPTVASVASQLNVHPRTLQRLLEGAGTTFGMVLDDLRRQTARRLLTTTNLSIAQVARQVGYVEPATFSRRARAWWGVSPLTVRREASAAAREDDLVAIGQDNVAFGQGM